jgi:hypothetical protein
MLLQTNSYIVPKDKRGEHARLMRRFRQTLLRLGCDQFEVYEQVGANWTGVEASGRYVQIMRFRDLKHQHVVQSGERNDPTAQALIAEFCDLVNFAYQQQQGLFAVGFYHSVLPITPARMNPADAEAPDELGEAQALASGAGEESAPGTEATPDEVIEEPQDANLPEHPQLPEQSEQATDGLSGQATDADVEIPTTEAVEGELEDVDFGEGPNGEEAA